MFDAALFISKQSQKQSICLTQGHGKHQLWHTQAVAVIRGYFAHMAVETAKTEYGQKAVQCIQCNFRREQIHEVQTRKKSSDRCHLRKGSGEGMPRRTHAAQTGRGQGVRGAFSLSAWFAFPAVTMKMPSGTIYLTKKIF